jgi:hypothetical protein
MLISVVYSQKFRDNILCRTESVRASYYVGSLDHPAILLVARLDI